jgi:superfamily II DNA or RNA helicase
VRRSLRLRRWQKEALDTLATTPRNDFLAVATPGAGKTTFALTAAVTDLAERPHRRVVIVAPTAHLKFQWAMAASQFGLHLEPEWQPVGGWPHDFHGVVVTYQQVASDPRAIRAHTDDAFVVLDEIHHAGSERAWGDGVFTAFEPAGRRLSLSGTPFRSDQNPIPFVEYAFDEARADYVYGYGEALREGGVVRPVFFPSYDGQMEWSTPDGAIVSATFSDDLDRTLSSQRLRTALSIDGDWLPTVLGHANRELSRLREQDPTAGGLVIAMDVDHARGIADLLQRVHGVAAVVATSDDPDASERIADFAAGRSPWIVAVRMVSEGVDIPRLRVAVYATNTVTELFFRQAVGRVVRWTPGHRRQKAFFFIPDDPRLLAFAHGLQEQRTHSLRRRQDDGDQPPVEAELARTAPGDQMSLFQAISATALDDEAAGGVFDDAHPEDLIHDDHDTAGFDLELPPPPPRAPVGDGAARDAGVPRTQLRKELRQANRDRVLMLVNLTGMSPREVNGKLNASAGVTSVEEATLQQLQVRLREADKWLAAV